MAQFKNFGDVSPEHGQTWLAYGDTDYANCVEVMSGADIGLADNQYRIESGSIYFSPSHWDSALDVIGCDRIGPPTYDEVALAFHAFAGFDEYWFRVIVQIGAKPDDWTARQDAPKADTVLHGNTKISRYLERFWLY